ncbi:hypothetical protein GCM10009634_60520 [Saccharothrix xinjiangensis]
MVPASGARTKAENALIAWIDQCGLRSDAAPPGRSWAPKGHMPIVKVPGKRLRINVMSVVASRGALWFTVCTDRRSTRTREARHVAGRRCPVGTGFVMDLVSYRHMSEAHPRCSAGGEHRPDRAR